ncbi:Rho-binding antiterminator [Endozoicomonas sp. G2_1]|uniref:Rho-binding antiterminator n=1 Tax=Endozoicomonas sp. G2_1 TaxID=2821091 RepID=UPI001ADCDF8F|nr:Rho-binding antiterminator [Endozoicomonas sp. G2_1]MBO9489094.1 Rho-binding antiterminator [Endozoicomonas sp. G2_1]
MLSCDLHDYLEIACMFNIPVVVTCINGDKYQGIPVTTFITSEKVECLKLKLENGDELLSIPLETLESMQALVSNPHFDLVNFK